MANKRYIVNLSIEEQESLKKIIKSGESKARVQTRARILLLIQEHPSWSNKVISQSLSCSLSTVERTIKRCVEEGLEGALYEKRRNRVYERKLDAMGEAQLVTLACSNPPEGRSVWTMQLLADELISLGYVDTISDETVRRTLKKMQLNLGVKKVG
jgi:transposase